MVRVKVMVAMVIAEIPRAQKAVLMAEVKVMMAILMVAVKKETATRSGEGCEDAECPFPEEGDSDSQDGDGGDSDSDNEERLLHSDSNTGTADSKQTKMMKKATKVRFFRKG